MYAERGKTQNQILINQTNKSVFIADVSFVYQVGNHDHCFAVAHYPVIPLLFSGD